MYYPKELPKWKNRPLEIRYFYNPLVILNLILNLIIVYREEHNRGIPLPVIFTIIPFFLHKDLYDSLPKTKTTLFTNWLDQKKGQDIKYFFIDRYKSLYPYIQEALLLGFSQKLLYIDDRVINSQNTVKDKGLQTKMRILSTWFAPNNYTNNMNEIGVVYEFSN